MKVRAKAVKEGGCHFVGIMYKETGGVSAGASVVLDILFGNGPHEDETRRMRHGFRYLRGQQWCVGVAGRVEARAKRPIR